MKNLEQSDHLGPSMNLEDLEADILRGIEELPDISADLRMLYREIVEEIMASLEDAEDPTTSFEEVQAIDAQLAVLRNGGLENKLALLEDAVDALQVQKFADLDDATQREVITSLQDRERREIFRKTYADQQRKYIAGALLDDAQTMVEQRPRLKTIVTKAA